MKSVSGSPPRAAKKKKKVEPKAEPKQNWRLKKTLSRAVDMRPIEEDDLRYIWAAYSMGGFPSLAERFVDGEMSSAKFTKEFGEELITNYDEAWTLLVKKTNGLRPVGLVLAFSSHWNPAFSPFMIVADMIWFPWATPRNKIETTVKFFHEVRKTMQMVEYSKREHQKFFDTVCAHGVLRRAGTSHVVYPDQATAIYETRKV